MRALAIGDPQTTLNRFLSALHKSGVLGADGRILDGVSLLSIGDHFDFKPPAGQTVQDVGQEGIAILEWLESHPPAQARILMGNHDVCRVMELHRIDDDTFAQAQSCEDAAEFASRFPDIPTPGIARRDFSSFCVAQRTLIQRLLLSGRMKLAAVGITEDGQPILLTHAGITTRELSLLGLADERRPSVIAATLNAFLAQRLERVRQDWEAGRLVPLDLAPVHLPGVSGREGGGLLYHRPQERLEDEWARQGARRYHPSALPVGLLQACGHTQHKKMGELLSKIPSISEGALRSLWFDETIRYCEGLVRRELGCMWMIDSGLHHSHTPTLLELEGLVGFEV